MSNEKIIFDDEEVEKYLTVAEADILHVLHQKIMDCKRDSMDIPKLIKDRVGKMVNQKGQYLLNCGYNSLEVIDIDQSNLKITIND